MSALLLLLIYWAGAVQTSMVLQSPDTVSVTSGDSFSLRCRLEFQLRYCYSSSSWYKVNPRTGVLDPVEIGEDGEESSGPDQTKICTKTISPAGVRDSGTYYCVVFGSAFVMMGTGTRVVVTEKGPLTPSIITYTPLEMNASSVLLQALVMGAVPSQVNVYWMIDDDARPGWTESAWTGDHDLASEFTRAQIRISAEEWAGASHVRCVAAWDGKTVSQSLQQSGRHTDMCPALLLGVGVVCVLTAAAIATIVLFLYRDKRASARARRRRGKQAQIYQHGAVNRDTFRPRAEEPSSTITEVEYSCLNPDSFTRTPSAPPQD